MPKLKKRGQPRKSTSKSVTDSGKMTVRLGGKALTGEGVKHCGPELEKRAQTGEMPPCVQTPVNLEAQFAGTNSEKQKWSEELEEEEAREALLSQ